MTAEGSARRLDISVVQATAQRTPIAGAGRLVAPAAALGGTDRSHRLPHVLGVSAVAVALVVSAVGPVRFVAEQNVARAVDPTLVPPDGQTGLDTAYLWSLDDDALEPLLVGLPRLDADTRRAVAAPSTRP
jgi:hypothetical protein